MKSEKKKKKILIIYFLTLGGIVILLGIIILAPYLKSKSLSLNVFVYAIFSPVCHQIPSRSFFLFGYPLAVCCRCFGVYFGFFAGALLHPFLKGFSHTTLPKAKTFIIISFPLVLDTLGNFSRLWMTDNIIRFIIGFLWGLILPFYFIAGISDYFINFRRYSKMT